MRLRSVVVEMLLVPPHCSFKRNRSSFIDLLEQ